MESHIFGEDIESVDTAILIKDSAFNINSLEAYYVNPLHKLGISKNRIAALSLYYSESNKVSAKEGKAYVLHLLEKIKETNVKTLIVADSNYFKYLTKQQKVTNCRGYVYKCTITGYEHYDVILSVNYNAVFHNENQKKDLDLSIKTIAGHVGADDLKILGSNIIKHEAYPTTTEEISNWLAKLMFKPVLTCDIETYSLRFEKAGIGTIGFAWSESEGIAFPVENNPEIKALIKEFLKQYDGTLIFHNLLFDDKVLIYTLFMEHDADWDGLKEGLDIAAKHEDSMVVAYLATNNTVENVLGLKELSYEYLGSYAEEVSDITKVPMQDLLTYNLKDCLGTMYVWNKYYPMLEKENQLDFYNNMAKPSLKVSLKMMLTGLPMDMAYVAKAKKEIASISNKNKNFLKHNPVVKEAKFIINKNEWKKANDKLKKKVRLLSEFKDELNPNSDQQLQVLLYDVMGLPVLDTTKGGAPSTSSKVIKRVYDHDKAQKYTNILDAIIGISETDIILNTFISAFEEYAFTRKTPNQEFNNTVWLNGDLKTTGTKSGRFASASPNMTNLPSGSAYGKAIKACFRSPSGWLFASADFSALTSSAFTQ